MKTKLIKGLSQVQSKYDAFFIDLWGVIHNGIELYPGAIDVLENLNKLENISFLYRKVDQYSWKFCNKGFFNFKNYIPKIIQEFT